MAGKFLEAALTYQDHPGAWQLKRHAFVYQDLATRKPALDAGPYA